MGTHYKGSPQEVQALDTFIKLNRAAESVDVATRSAYTAVGLTDSQFAVLELLYHLGPQSQLTIGKKILKSRGNMTLVIGNLKRDGLILREKDITDRRFYSINLTKKGHEFIKDLFPKHVKEVVRVMGALTLAEQAELGRLCKKLGLKA